MHAGKTEISSLKLALVLPVYLPESYGGGEQQSRKLSEALAAQGVDVTILTTRLRASTPSREMQGRIAIRRFRVAHLPNLGGRYIGSFLAWSFQLSRWLFCHRREYDIIQITHGRLHCIPAVAMGMLLGKPTLIKLGRGGKDIDFDTVRSKKIYGAAASKFIARHTSAFVANSSVIVNDLSARGISHSRIFKIPNGVEIPDVDISKKPPSEFTRFLYFGRLDAEKGIDRMIRGFAKLPRASQARLRLVGDGACQPALEELCQSLGIADRVSFLPPTDDVSSILREADFYVSTSLSEGMSNALLEAMAYGVPPIVSRVSGVDDVVANEESGFVFEPGDDDGYVRALQRALALSRDARLEMAQSAMAAMRDRFGIEMVASNFIQAFKSLL